jgi:hypothetical protein
MRSSLGFLSRRGPVHVPIASDIQWAGAAPPATNGNISWTAGTPGTFTYLPKTSTGYVLTNGDKYIFAKAALSGSVTGFVPEGITAIQPYYIVNLSGNTFNLATSPGGSGVAVSNTSSTPTGSVAMTAKTLSSTGIMSGGGTGECHVGEGARCHRLPSCDKRYAVSGEIERGIYADIRPEIHDAAEFLEHFQNESP